MKQTLLIVAALSCAIPLLASAAEDEPSQIKPESYVRFPESAVACLTKEDLQKIIEHFTKGENTKGNAMIMSKGNPNAGCVMLDNKKSFKVLSSEYNDPDHPEMGLIEVVGKGSKSAEGAWTFTMFAEQSKN